MFAVTDQIIAERELETYTFVLHLSSLIQYLLYLLVYYFVCHSALCHYQLVVDTALFEQFSV